MSELSQRIDMHSHFYGGGLLETLMSRTERPYLRKREDGALMMVAMNGEFEFTEHYHDYRVGLERMKAAGLTHRMLTFPGALGVELLPAGEISEAISAYNNYLAQLTQETDGALIGLAGVPLADMNLACAEVKRIRRDLGLPGSFCHQITSIRSQKPRSYAPCWRRPMNTAVTSCCTPD